MVESLTFVSQKVHKIRWQPTSSVIQKSNIFATGSYEDSVNSVTIWSVDHMIPTINQDEFEMSDLETSRPLRQCQYRIPGDVTGMEFGDRDKIVVGTSSGDVLLLSLNLQFEQIDLIDRWESLHKSGGSTDIACNLPEVVTVGEDGSIHVIRIDNRRPLRSFMHGDSYPLTCVSYLNSHELCTANTVGHLRLWDTRSHSNSPSRVMVSSETPIALRSVDHHPTQCHVLATGGSDGCMTVFDVRMECAPVTKMHVHDRDIWEIHFHGSSPNHVYTCSDDGNLRKLDVSFEMTSLLSGSTNVGMTDVVADCGSSINSCDVTESILICSTDAESVYIVDDAT